MVDTDNQDFDLEDDDLLDGDTDIAEDDTPESTRDIASRVYDELQDKADDEEEITVIGEKKPAAARDKTGRFAQKTTVVEPGAATEQQTNLPHESTITTPTDEAPQSFTADERAAYNQLPPEQKAVHRRLEQSARAHFHRKDQELTRIRQTLGNVEQALTPERLREFAEEGRTPGEVISNLLASQEFLNHNPVEALQHLCRNLGVHPNQLLGQSANQSNQNVQQPQRQSDPQIQSLTQQMQEMHEYVSRMQEHEHEQTVHRTVGELKTIVEEKDSAGNPVRPELREFIADPTFRQTLQFLKDRNPTANTRDVIDAAYKHHISSTPELWNRFLARQTQAQARAKAAEEKARAQKARAASGLTGSAGAGHTRSTPNSTRDAIALAYDELS